MAILEKLIQLYLLCRLKIGRNLARPPPALTILIRVLLTLFEGDASESGGGRGFFKRIITMILVFFYDHRFNYIFIVVFYDKGP